MTYTAEREAERQLYQHWQQARKQRIRSECKKPATAEYQVEGVGRVFREAAKNPNADRLPNPHLGS